MKKILPLVIALALGGCSSAIYFSRMSAGHVGCPQQEMVISDDSTLLNGSQTWTAAAGATARPDRDPSCTRDEDTHGH